MIDSRLLDFHKGTNREKADPKFGIQVARSISSTVDRGYNGYYTRRNAKIKVSRDIAAGHQDMTQFLDLMNIDGKKAFVNLDLSPPCIAPKFMDIITEHFMERSEDVKVSAIDPQSKRKQERAKEEAEFRMENKDLIGALQQESGIPVEDPSAYTPEDKDDLDFYFGYEYQLPEEIKFEKATDYVLIDNDWKTVCKRKVLEDMEESGFSATRTYVDVNGKIKIRVCEPENTFYSWSKFNDLRDIAWCGELYKMKVTEYRARFANDYIREYGEEKAEQKLFEDVMKAVSQYPDYTSLSWQYEWSYAYYRPYDDWQIEVMDFEFKTVDNDIYTAKTNKYGNLIAVDKRDRMPQNLGDNKEVIVKQVYNIYRGYYVRKLDKLFNWELAKNMIRPQSNLSDVYFSYSFYMPKNRDMINVTLPERMKSSVNQMTLAHLKIQHLIAKMRPAGLLVDINGLLDIDLGLGGTVTPLELQKVYDQTGNQYYRSIKDDGETRQNPPIQELPNAGSIPQIQSCITTYNFYLERLRQDLGTNEYVEGQSVNPKLGLGVMQNQMTASNRATAFIYEGYLSLMQNTCRKVSMLLWDNVMFGGKEYREFIGDEELDEAYFDVNIEMLPDEMERAKIDAKIETALSAGIIEFQDAFKIGNIKNVKLKELYLARAQKRIQQMKIQENQANIKATSDAQIASAQATTQGKQQELQMEYQGKLAITQMSTKASSELEMQKFVQELQMESFKTGKPIPQEMQDIVDAFYEAKAEEEIQEQEMADSMMEQQEQQEGMAQEQMAQTV
jgi:hypothetical protein